MLSKVIKKIEAQQKGKEGTPPFFVGEHLKDILKKCPPACIEIVSADLDIKEMSIVHCEKKIKEYADKHKSVEGSAAMFLTSAVAIACVLLTHNHLTLPAYIVIPVAGAAVSTLVEMVTKDGRDTIYCPTAAMLIMLPLMALFGGLA